MMVERRKIIKQIAKERIEILLKEAEKTWRTNKKRAKTYLKNVKRLCEHYKVRLTKSQKRTFCRKCFTFFIPGESMLVRFDSDNRFIMYICKECGKKIKMRY